MNDTVSVSLLGPVEVRVGGRTTPLVGIKQQSLLAMLALAVPQPVSDDRLIEELWGDEQPANPSNALQALVSQLRRVLGREVVVRHGAGYALRLDAQQVDCALLERLVHDGHAAAEQGDHTTAEEDFRAAVALVRGPPLGELADAWFARARPRLEEVAVAAHEGLVDAELAMARHADALPMLNELVDRHPLRERFHAQLIVALYRAGRQADALQAYRDARQRLLEELGLDPGPELQALERAVLTQDPALAAPIVLTPAAPPRRQAVPEQLTSFVGRTRELADLAATVRRERLTTIVGPAGVGKTRLALELVRQLAEEGEVWYIELAPLTEESTVAEAIASTVGALERAPAGGRSAPTAEQRAVTRLGDREAVIVLDNCEHVAGASAACVRTLLAGCRHLRGVATSREPLGIDGERQFALGPLDDGDSVTLFVERARAVQPMFNPGATGELTELCRHLDRLPLAIELAAARTKTLPVREIAERLRDRFRLLRRTAEKEPDRHSGLEAAIDWSYDLLFEDERRMLRTLAVFAGGATLDAAEQVCGPDALELASRLVDRSLLLADTSGTTVRFTMLETVRAYGLARLDELGATNDARNVHLQWCIGEAAGIERGIRGPDQLAWLGRLDHEHDNFRAALGYAVEHQPAGALRLLASVLFPWWLRGRRAEVRRWIELCLLAGRDEEPYLRARVLAPSGLFVLPAGRTVAGPSFGRDFHDELDIAERRQREALSILVQSDDELTAANARLVLVNTLLRRVSAALPVAREEIDETAQTAREAFDRLGDDFGSALMRVTHAIALVAYGELDDAMAEAQRAMSFVRRCGDRFSLGRVSYILGLVADLRGDTREAYRQLENSLRLLDEVCVHQFVTAHAQMLCSLAERNGDMKLALQWRAFVDEHGDAWTHYDGTVLAAAHNREGLAARTTGDLAAAAADHAAALAWYASAGLLSGVAFSESCLGFLAAARGDLPGAAAHHAAALSAATRDDDPAALALAIEGCAAVAGEPRDTAVLLGAASQMWSQAVAIDPTHRDDVAVADDAARSALGDDGHRAARIEGANLDRRDVLELARRTVRPAAGQM